MKFDRIRSERRYCNSRLYRTDSQYASTIRGCAYTYQGIVDVYATLYQQTGATAVLFEMCYDGRMWRWSIEDGGTMSIPHLSKWAAEFADEVVRQAK